MHTDSLESAVVVGNQGVSEIKPASSDDTGDGVLMGLTVKMASRLFPMFILIFCLSLDSFVMQHLTFNFLVASICLRGACLKSSLARRVRP